MREGEGLCVSVSDQNNGTECLIAWTVNTFMVLFPEPGSVILFYFKAYWQRCALTTLCHNGCISDEDAIMKLTTARKPPRVSGAEITATVTPCPQIAIDFKPRLSLSKI